jgi:hypothetical protein
MEFKSGIFAGSVITAGAGKLVEGKLNLKLSINDGAGHLAQSFYPCKLEINF